MAEPVCIVGHKSHAYECPGCAEARGRPQPLENWRWYRTRTSSKRIRAAVAAVVAERTESCAIIVDSTVKAQESVR